MEEGIIEVDALRESRHIVARIFLFRADGVDPKTNMLFGAGTQLRGDSESLNIFIGVGYWNKPRPLFDHS